MYLVKKINYVDGYKISLTFNDKTTKIVDLESYLTKGVFLPLRDPDYFCKVRLIGNTIAWPNEADFCPDVLYEIGRVLENESEPFGIKKRKKSIRSTSSKSNKRIFSSNKGAVSG